MAVVRRSRGFVLDVFRELHEDDTWICRRDPAIRRPWSEIVAESADGIPYLVPEVVLLFKAKSARDKDVSDLRAVLPTLDERGRAWLSGALQRVHPGHEWASAIDRPTSARRAGGRR